MENNLEQALITSETLFKVFTVLSPFVAIFLAYLFGVLDKRKDIELESEKQINTVVSSLLKVWFQLTRVDLIIKEISETTTAASRIFPLEFIPYYIFSSNLLDKDSYANLDNDIESLKMYTPATYFSLEGMGRINQHLYDEFLIPILTNPKLGTTIMVESASPVLTALMKDFKSKLDLVITQLRKEERNKVEKILNENSTNLNQGNGFNIEKEFYTLSKQMAPNDLGELTFEEFKEKVLTDSHFKKVFHDQMEKFLSLSFKDFLHGVSEDEGIAYQSDSSQS